MAAAALATMLGLSACGAAPRPGAPARLAPADGLRAPLADVAFEASPGERWLAPRAGEAPRAAQAASAAGGAIQPRSSVPRRHAETRAALAQGQPTSAWTTLWAWLSGPFKREPKVEAVPRGPAPAPDAFWLGVNLPWVNYGADFGANAWHPDGGLSRPAARAELEAAFTRLEAAGIRQVRWFLFCDGRAGMRFAADGTPAGLDEHVFADLDLAIATARAHRVRIVFALLDFYFLQAERVEGGVRMRGHADVFRDEAKRRALFDTVYEPLAERYGRERTVLAWDLINEPEWSTFGVAAWKPTASVAPAELRAYVREAAALFHREAEQPVTVGSASARWLPLVQGLGLDFYQAHWYDHLERLAPLARPTFKLKLDRPVVLGEFPSKGSKRSVEQILETAHGAGYAGGWAWAMLSDDDATAFDEAEPQLVRWRDAHRAFLAEDP